MYSAAVPAILGLLIILLGISNIRGNISSVHWYHRKRIAKEDVRPFGRLIGGGTVIIGSSLVVLGCFALAEEMTGDKIYMEIGAATAVIGIAAGVILSLYAVIKYNKGLF